MLLHELLTIPDMNTAHDADDILVDDLPAPRHSRRLAVVTETYPPEVNGVAMSMARVVDGLNRRNHDVQLIRPRQPAKMSASTLR